MSRSVLAVTIVFASSLGLAQEEPDPAARREANAFLREGNRLIGRGDPEGALDLFRRAYDRLPSPRILVNVATALAQLHRDVEAAETYERVLAAPPEEIPAEMRRSVESALAEVDTRVGRIRIGVSGDGAAVTIDGQAAGTSPFAAPVRVAPGPHVVAASIGGGAAVEASVEVRAAETAAVSLAPSPAVAQPQPVDEPATARPDLRVVAEPEPPATPPPGHEEDEEEDDDGSIFGRWWLWAGVGVVAAGAVTAVLVASGGDSNPPGSDTELGTVR